MSLCYLNMLCKNESILIIIYFNAIHIEQNVYLIYNKWNVMTEFTLKYQSANQNDYFNLLSGYFFLLYVQLWQSCSYVCLTLGVNTVLNLCKQSHVKYWFFRKKFISPTGNWTPVSRVTGGDTHHYTIEDVSTLRIYKVWQSD